MKFTNTISTEKIVTAIISFFLPLLSIPIVFFQIVNRKQKIYFTILTLILGLVAYSSAPTGDLYRHYIFYYNLSFLSFKDAISFIFSGLDFIVPITMFISTKLSLGIQWISFTVVVVMFHIIFKYFQQISISNNKVYNTKTVYFLILFSLVFSQNFLVYSLKLRAPLAQALILLFFSKLLVEHKTKWGILILATLTHFSSIITLPIYFLSRKISLNKLRNAFLYSIIFIPISKIFIEIVYNLSKPLLIHFPDLYRQINPYIEGYWAFDYFEDFSIKVLAQYYISIIPYFIILLYFVIYKYKSKERKIIYSYLIFINLIFSFTNVFTRFYTVAIVIGIYVIMMEYGRLKVIIGQKILILSLSFFIFIYGSINVLAQRRPLKIAYTKEMLYTNVISMLFKNYPMEWVNAKIDDDGYIIGDRNNRKE